MRAMDIKSYETKSAEALKASIEAHDRAAAEAMKLAQRHLRESIRRAKQLELKERHL